MKAMKLVGLTCDGGEEGEEGTGEKGKNEEVGEQG